MKTVRAARQSVDGKYVVCGGCGATLCRRDERQALGGLALMVDGQRVHGTQRSWRLVWDETWRLVGDHIERSASMQRRLQDDRKPSRHDWANKERIELQRALDAYVPALCECDTLNTVNPRRLRVDGVAGY